MTNNETNTGMRNLKPGWGRLLENSLELKIVGRLLITRQKELKQLDRRDFVLESETIAINFSYTILAVLYVWCNLLNKHVHNKYKEQGWRGRATSKRKWKYMDALSLEYESINVVNIQNIVFWWFFCVFIILYVVETQWLIFWKNVFIT